MVGRTEFNCLVRRESAATLLQDVNPLVGDRFDRKDRRLFAALRAVAFQLAPIAFGHVFEAAMVTFQRLVEVLSFEHAFIDIVFTENRIILALPTQSAPTPHRAIRLYAS